MSELSWPDGAAAPVLGLGTWRMGEQASRAKVEVGALRQALDIGYRLIDTAEMYGEGGAEQIVGTALREAGVAGLRRDQVFITSKFYPHHADRAGVQAACERSLRRLGVDTIDLYLLHWRGATPLNETVQALERLQQQGRIKRWGVSNFDLDDMTELMAIEGGGACAANQVYFSLGARGVEFELLPWLQRRSMPLMAYSPIDQGQLCTDARLATLAGQIGLAPATLALAWVVSRPGVMAIPKAGQLKHLEQNWAAREVQLDAGTLQALDELFPPPTRRQPLAMR